MCNCYYLVYEFGRAIAPFILHKNQFNISVKPPCALLLIFFLALSYACPPPHVPDTLQALIGPGFNLIVTMDHWACLLFMHLVLLVGIQLVNTTGQACL